MSAKTFSRLAVAIALTGSLTGCLNWFTDFKEQPKIDPWDTPNITTPPRGNPQGSVPTHGTVAPDFAYGRTSMALESMSGLVNPTAVDQASVDRGRKSFQINCAVCHGPAAMGNGVVLKYGVYPPSIGANSPAANQRSDGYIFAVIRNGKNLMPSYNRIEEAERWDLINYLRTLQGKTGLTADTTHGLPGETGDKVPGASVTAPTRPAPFFNPKLPAARADTGRPPEAQPAKPPTPEAQK